jgi:anti-anti-sigma factor
MLLTIDRREKRPTVFEIALIGRLDTDTSAQLERMLNLTFEGPVRGLHLNLEKLAYISSAGIRVVILAAKKARAAGATFTMSDLQPQIRKVFEIVQALPAQTIFASVKEADAYFDEIQKRALAGPPPE